MRQTTILALQAAGVAALLALAGCGGSNAKDSKPATQAVLLAPEDVVTVRPSAITAGPLITGSLQPDKRADLRAEVSAVVTAVLKENGDAVKRGDLLVRLDDTSIREGLVSAQEAERVAVQATDQAERQLQRLNTLRASGMARRRRWKMPRFAATARKATWPRPARGWCRPGSSCSAPKSARPSTASWPTASCRSATPRRSARNC
jgi:multidrug efflux pump subunit AcrA (membrane-fusion protein)